MKLASITVEEFSTPSPIKVKSNEKLSDIWKLMQTQSIRHVLVEDQNNIVGIVSERDITTFSQSEDFSSYVAQDVMSKDLLTASPETNLYDVALEMSEKKVGSTLVSDPGTDYLGIFTATDALNALVEVLRGDLDQD